MYRITPRCEKALDRYEGFPHLYRKEVFAAEIGRGRAARVVEVMFYVMNETHISPPSPYYLQTIEDGFNDWKIPAATLRKAVNNAYRFTAAKAKRIASRSTAAEVQSAADQKFDGIEGADVQRRSATLPRLAAHR